MMTEELLSQLRDIHLPPQITGWPPAPGWWCLLILGLLFMVAMLFFWQRRRRRVKVKKMVLHQLRELQEKSRISGEQAKHLIALSMLLKRIALLYFPRAQVAGLQGQQWLQFLTDVGKDTNFVMQGRLLIDAPYQKSVTQDMTPLLELSIRWVKQLKVK